MKKNIKRVLAAILSVSTIAFGGISASAATADDVISSARAAGFLEVYVTQLQNFILVNDFNSEQYDMMIGALSNIESYGDEVALKYFGKTLAEMRGESDSGNDDDSSGSSSEDKDKDKDKIINNTDNLSSDSWAAQVVDKMTNEDLINSLDEIISTGKELGLDITVEQLGDKSFTMTIKDEDGNIQLVAPIGKIVSTTGVDAKPEANAEVDNKAGIDVGVGSIVEAGVETAAKSGTTDNRFISIAAICASIMAAGGIGVWVISRKNRKIGE